MGIKKPYYRNYRSMAENNNSGYSSRAYILDPEYSNQPEHFVRAFLLIQDDLKKLFEYIEPSNECLKTFSYRIHELLMRTCIEIEANFKAILAANIYTPKNHNFNMSVYKKINITHRLSSYKVILPIWNQKEKIFVPFNSWKNLKIPTGLAWYQAYNASKHDRHENFKQANLENLLDAISALLILLSSQFGTEDFSGGPVGLAIDGYEYYEGEAPIGEYFRVKFPEDWPEEEKYDFNWASLKNDNNRFNKINYDLIL